MNKYNITALTAAIALAFSTAALANPMSKTDYKGTKKAIEAEYKSAKASCDAYKGNANDVCEAEAKGKEQVALAELEQTYKPSDKNRYDARIAKAKAVHSVAVEKCDDKAGNDKDVCKKEADSAQTAAKADAKTQRTTADARATAGEKTSKAHVQADKKIVEARKDARDDKRDAEYAVAKEKCDTLAGNPKDICVSDAKTRYGKS
jgi:hypothetical protein